MDTIDTAPASAVATQTLLDRIERLEFRLFVATGDQVVLSSRYDELRDGVTDAVADARMSLAPAIVRLSVLLDRLDGLLGAKA